MCPTIDGKNTLTFLRPEIGWTEKQSGRPLWSGSHFLAREEVSCRVPDVVPPETIKLPCRSGVR
ncbi:hypothetical protein GCM10023192_64020 [Amycolatopsis samaneae]